ncbi:UNVERIFIED_CONTAM: hypothetical protein Sangu_2839600 [Sesamum angustifolium]|uniref:Uncharacterized protein n=1 Tax=Sesamum angustifolium TaxID=2727405 RepID=A0AAW2IQ41_9LAMI
MASTAIIFLNALSPSLYSSRCCRSQAFSPDPSQFLSSMSLSKFKNQTLYSSLQIKKFKNRNVRASPVVFAAQSNFLRGTLLLFTLSVDLIFVCCPTVIQTVWKVGKDGIEAGTNLVPAAIPRPIARISVTIAAVMVSLFLLKSFLSTAFFALVYFRILPLQLNMQKLYIRFSTALSSSLYSTRKLECTPKLGGDQLHFLYVLYGDLSILYKS